MTLLYYTAAGFVFFLLLKLIANATKTTPTKPHAGLVVVIAVLIDLWIVVLLAYAGHAL